MENLENAYIKSLLSKVAYENGIDVGYNFNFLGTEFSNAEREYLNENYEVMEQIIIQAVQVMKFLGRECYYQPKSGWKGGVGRFMLQEIFSNKRQEEVL